MMDNQLTSSCKDCVFAVYIGKTQTEFKLGRVEKFREKGVDIIEAEDLEENELFVVEAWCNYYRNQEWKEAFDTSVSLTDKVKEEAVFPVGFIVLFDNDSSTEDLEKTISGIKEIEGEASYVTIANSSESDPIEFISTVQDLFGDSEIDYKVTRIMEKETYQYQSIDLCFSNINNIYYYILRAGNKPAKDVISLIDKQTNTELEPVVYIKGDENLNGTVVQATMHKFLNGYYGMTLLEKIEGIQSEDGSTKSVVWTWEEIRNGKQS